MKTFLACWGEGYGQEGSEEVLMEFFTERRGYRPDAIERIKTMLVNDLVDLTELGAVHYVIRTS